MLNHRTMKYSKTEYLSEKQNESHRENDSNKLIEQLI